MPLDLDVIFKIIMMELHSKVVDERSQDSAHMRHDPRDPEEVVSKWERLAAKAGNQGQQAAKKKNVRSLVIVQNKKILVRFR